MALEIQAQRCVAEAARAVVGRPSMTICAPSIGEHPTPPAAGEGQTCRECRATNDAAAETCLECGLDLEWGNWIEVTQEQPPAASDEEPAPDAFGGVRCPHAEVCNGCTSRADVETLTAAVRAEATEAERERSGDWIDYSCRCCHARPQQSWWKFCPYCGTDIPLSIRQRPAGEDGG